MSVCECVYGRKIIGVYGSLWGGLKVTGVNGSQMRAFNPPGYGVTGGCEPHNVDTEKQTPKF